MIRHAAIDLLAACAAQAQTIYPLTRAEIMSGAKFDFKGEFPGPPALGDVKITVAGQDPATLFGKPGRDGQPRRRRSDYNDSVRIFWDVKPDVIMGGGSPNFLAKSTPGSLRWDEVDYIKQFEAAG